jgi:predicted metalloprotease with PDZ domain
MKRARGFLQYRFVDSQPEEVKRMRKVLWSATILLLCVAASSLPAQERDASMAFTVSMERPTSHYFHVVLRCDGLKGEVQDYKMPSWTPGYYQIMDYARNVVRFRAEDGAGRPLEWEKSAKNTWQVKSKGTASITVRYDVYAYGRSVAESYLDDARAFISPTGVFMHVGGRTEEPVTVKVEPYRAWTRVSSGLDTVAGRANTFFAPDFDVLYDSPMLAGNQEVLTFDVRGVPHRFVGDDLGTLDRTKLVSDLRAMVESAVALIGEIPYRHYTFLAIGPGGGGLEHGNSVALTFAATGLNTPGGYKSWLNFVTHEFFHLYNVKRIRPIALGPFDYDRENYTRMLWVSEGFTVYYEYLILNRAGLLGRGELLEQLRSTIARYENSPGHRFQSATESSFDTWINFFSRGEHASNTTISYYDKGAVLGMLLDLKIRHETKNAKSLDDVMRTLYQTYYREKKRGFTDREFREVCEKTAGSPLPEIFDVYASTVGDIDYEKYLAYAGLEIDATPADLPGATLGAAVREQNGVSLVTSVEWDSPASLAGLSAQDEIIATDGVRATPQALSEILSSRKGGDTLRVYFSRRGVAQEIGVVLGRKSERTFHITPLPNPTPLQQAILDDWAREE